MYEHYRAYSCGKILFFRRAAESVDRSVVGTFWTRREGNK